MESLQDSIRIQGILVPLTVYRSGASIHILDGEANKWVFGLIGLFMVLLSFIFWKLDQRTKGMIKVSEQALKLSEAKICATLGKEEYLSVAPFHNDAQALGLVGKTLFGILTYSECFAAVFIAFAALGVGIFTTIALQIFAIAR